MCLDRNDSLHYEVVKTTPILTAAHVVGHSVPARLPRCLQPGRHTAGWPYHEHRRIPAQHGDQRLHLRQGAPLHRARVRKRSSAAIRRSARDRKDTDCSSEPRGTMRMALIARALRGGARALGRRVDPALFLRRLERAADAGHRATRRCSAGSEHRGWRARSARRRPARPTRRSTARCRRSPTRISPTRASSSSGARTRQRPAFTWCRYIREAQRNGATLIVIDPRTTTLAKQADIHLAIKPGTDLPVALSIHRFLFEEGLADREFLDAHTRHAEQLRAKALPWTFERAAAEAGRLRSGKSRPSRSATRKPRPALIRCGWGQERNRNGGNSTLAILALPAVAGKFGVRGGGYAMSNTAAWGIERTWIGAQEPATRLDQHEPARTRAHRDSIHRSACCSSTTRTRR